MHSEIKLFHFQKDKFKATISKSKSAVPVSEVSLHSSQVSSVAGRSQVNRKPSNGCKPEYRFSNLKRKAGEKPRCYEEIVS